MIAIRCLAWGLFWLGASASADTVLSFDQALVRLIEMNIAVQIQATQVESAAIRERQALFQFAPAVSLAAKSVRSGSGLTSAQQTGKQALASSELNFFRFGVDRADLLATRRDSDSQKALLESEFMEAEGQAVVLLVSELSAHLRVNIDREFVKLREQSYSIAKERFAQGLLAHQEVEKVQVDLENSRARLADAEIVQGEARAALTARLGQIQVEPVWPWKIKLLDKKSKIFTVTTELHPRLTAATSALESQEEKLLAKKGQFWPSLDANFSYGFYDGPAVSASVAQWAWSGALTLSFPIFNRFVNQSEIGLQAQAVSVSEKKRESVRIEVNQEQSASKRGFELAIESVVRRTDTLQISRRIYQDSLRRFRAGRVTADELLIDQDRLLASELLEVDGWSSAHKESTRYCHSQGHRLSDCL